jgi:cytochrome c peroxidase
MDCHVNGRTTGQIHMNPDDRPENRRFRLDTVRLRGMYNQHIHGSKRSLRSVEDFTEFEQRTAYFNGDEIHAIKKGMNILDRIQVSHMAQMQNMFDFPPAPKLDDQGHLDPSKATDAELRGEKLFVGKAQCASCHPAPFYLDQLMHDLHLERFVNEAPLGAIKTFTLRGIKDSPPYMHDGRCFTLARSSCLTLSSSLRLEPRDDLLVAAGVQGGRHQRLGVTVDEREVRGVGHVVGELLQVPGRIPRVEIDRGRPEIGDAPTGRLLDDGLGGVSLKCVQRGD